MPRLPPLPDLDWSPEGVPKARLFDDVYFSRDGGLAETDAVFLGGCGLPEGWRGKERFAVGELGFGSGLNALAVWRAWRATRAPGAVLHFVSIERAPLPVEAAGRVLQAFPEVAPLAERLLRAWPHRAPGAQRLWFADDGFALTLFVGQASEALARIEGRFDAWFLDGFAPAKNPDMWSAELLRQVAAVSTPGARLATYSVAAAVRRGLAEAGFEVTRRPGFGSKRERLEARLAACPTASGTLFPRAAESLPAGASVAVVGAGIAGAAAAFALRRRGVAVDVFDREGPAAGASGNPAAIVMPRLDRAETPIARFHRAAYLYALALYRGLGAEAFAPIGVFEPVRDDADRERLAAFAADPPLPPELLGVRDDGLLHLEAGVARPRAVIAALLDRAHVIGEGIERLERDGQAWVLRDTRGEARRYAAVVLAGGPALAGFRETAWLPLALTLGQIERAALKGPPPATAIASGAYAAPDGDGLVFGATFDRAVFGAAPCASDEAAARNLQNLAALAPELAALVDPGALTHRAGLRAAAQDRAPIAGLVPDAPAYLERFAGLRHGRAPDLSAAPPAHAGLYVLGALGARGFTTAPLLAEAVASDLLGEPSPLERDAAEACHPARFLVRALKKGRPVSS